MIGDPTTGLASWLATYLVHSTVVLGVAWWLAGRTRAPESRDRLWKLALSLSLVTATASRLGAARWELALPAAMRATVAGDLVSPEARAIDSHARGASTSTHAGVPPVAGSRDPEAGVAASAPGAAADPPAPRAADVATIDDPSIAAAPVRWPGVVVAVWLAVGLVLIAWRALAWFRLTRALAGRAVLADGPLPALVDRLCRAGGLRRIVRVTVDDRLPTPVVLSGREVCLPRRVVEALPDAQLQGVLAHELAHIRRRDPLWLAFCGALECVLFVQPLHRLARRRLFESAELLCDDWAARQTGARLELAQGLASVAGWLGPRAVRVPQPCLGEERRPLLARVERLLGDGHAPAAARPWTLAAGVAVLAVLLGAGPTVTVAGDEREALAILTLDELVARAAVVEGLLLERMLALPPDHAARHADLLALPGARAVRILQRAVLQTTMDGGGSYWSFVTEDHDYQREPDLQYEHRVLSTGFYGGNTGHVLDLGRIALGDVDLEAAPQALSSDDRTAFRLMVDREVTNEEQLDAFDRDVAQLYDGNRLRRPGQALASPGHTYLVRAILLDEHDVLAAFTITDLDPGSVVIVYRVLARGPMERRWPLRPRIEWPTGEAPAWMRDLDAGELRRLRVDVDDELGRRLLEVSETDVPVELRALRRRDDTGVVRLLERTRTPITSIREGGAYYAFTARTHEFGSSTDVGLEQGDLGAQDGVVVDVGDLPLLDVDRAVRPSGLTGFGRFVWHMATAFPSPRTEQEYDGWQTAWQERRGPGWPIPRGEPAAWTVPYRAADATAGEYDAATREGYDVTSAPAVVGHTYVLRSIKPSDHDVLVAFRVLSADEWGVTLAWRQLERWF